MKAMRTSILTAASLVGLALLLAPAPAAADFVINDDLIVDGSACIGFDCVNGESFGFDTIRLKENNLRIDFEDTSVVPSFPTNDWGIVINDSANGGAAYFGVEDRDAARFPFRIFAGARANALVVDSGGDIGIGTSTPVTDIHIKTGDTPALRLEQDTSSGFQAQTWDVAGNETNFFIRDVTNGSALPLRIRPGSPSNSIYIDGASGGDVGFGTSSPSEPIHVRRTDAAATNILIENANAAAQNTQLQLENGSGSRWDLRNTTAGQFAITLGGSGSNELVINDADGEVTIANDFTVNGTKNFAMPDPADSSRWIYYSALEGPEAGTYFRGTARLADGQAVIELPEHFAKVTEADGLTVQLTPLGGWHQLYVAEKSPRRLVVRDARGSDGTEFDFIVQGIRAGYADFQVDRPAPEGR